MSEATQRNTPETLAYYKAHAGPKWPFDPDGMCLAICRTGRNILPRYPSAVTAQNATPPGHRVHNVRDIRRGMVAYYDDPDDGNPYGHIVTVLGRVKNSDPDDLASLLVWTNSVKTNEVVVVRGDYFGRYWNDQFQFAATSLNGELLYDFHKPPEPEPAPRPPRRYPNLEAAIESINEGLIDLHRVLRRAEDNNNVRLATALKRDRYKMIQAKRAIRETIRNINRKGR